MNPVHKQATMLTIMDLTAFNSKAIFNTFFKKLVGATPTQYNQLPETIKIIAIDKVDMTN
jgi:AraC-like DNA-binding protein